jgi:hypothetical protein
MNTQLSDAICCPKFNPTPWDDKTLKWKEKMFIQGNVFTFLFMPLNYGSVITRMMKQIECAGAKNLDVMCLSDHASFWNMKMYLAVDKKVEGATNMTISGTFYSKVYEGDFKDTGVWSKDFENVVKKKGYTLKKTYMWYTTCPKCAKKYGKNYVVLLGGDPVK